MSNLFQWLVRLAGALILLAAVAIGLVYYLASRSLPDYDKTLTTSGLTAPVEIVRDNANVPHIFAKADEDAFFALGYVHAQDRLWQMVMLRRTAQGRLSELFGDSTLKIDTLLRRLDLYPLSVQSVQAQDAHALGVLRAYARGVNARIDEINRNSLGRGAPEMFLFPSAIAPWQPADSIAVQKLMALQLTGHLPEEVLRARASLLLEDETRLSDILPDAPGSGVAALADYAALVPNVPRFYASTGTPASEHPLSPLPKRGLAGASNAWAAAAQRSATDGTLLANDPHLGLTAPAIWYLARLDLAHGGVIGGTIPGMPVVLAGRSDHLGWGLTSSYLDDQDVFIEEINPDNPEEYRVPDGFKPFVTRKSIITIKGGQPITLTLRWTENGPVLPGSQFDLASVTPKGHVAALGWTALSARDTSMSAAINLMYATDVESAIAAAEPYLAPSQNLTLADRETIALKTIGAMPRREDAHHSKGRMPVLGWRAENRWRGRLPYAANPVFLAPRGGIVGNTNNKIVERPFPLHVS
ncbi:MAG: penicillin acylase family protein, partial [Rhodobacteraceae bacterium]|nr:penicillin acylase family protein [Paracoccaceae bacterium]